jgi:hypothetical protein
MKHPEALLIPVLMLLDYFLTLAGSIQQEKVYGKHFRVQHYEMNPLWQKTIAKKKWFNLRHLVLTAFVSAYVVWLTNGVNAEEEASVGLLGCLIGVFSLLVGRHISNLLIFGYLIQRPNAVVGHIEMSHQLVLAISTFQTIGIFIILIPVAYFSRAAFAYGAAAGVLIMIFAHAIWIIHAKRKEAKPRAAEVGG